MGESKEIADCDHDTNLSDKQPRLTQLRRSKLQVKYSSVVEARALYLSALQEISGHYVLRKNYELHNHGVDAYEALLTCDITVTVTLP